MSTRAKALPPPVPFFHRLRKSIHFACFLIFVLLPFFDVMRFDIPRQRFYFAGRELWISEFAIIFFSLMFLLFIVVGMALLYGRVYCGYLCPQTIFSEASQWVEARAKKWVTKRLVSWPAGRRRLLERVIFYGVVALASVFLAFVFISYFVEPRDLLLRLASLDVETAGGIAGAVVTLITFLDFAFVRQRFCTTACPYGYLQGMLVDKNSLLVLYSDNESGKKVCIECKKCVRVCPMGIDIRDSPHQLECVHCGECIDACEDILAKLGKPGLIHYAWGEKIAGGAEPWFRRFGLRDAKRIVVILILTFYASGLTVALSMRHGVYVRIMPVRTTSLYKINEQGRVVNHFRLNVGNRTSQPATVTLTSEGLEGTVIAMPRNPLPLAPSMEQEIEFDVIAPRTVSGREVEHFRLIARAAPENTVDTIAMTFLMPPEKRK